jgi:hypothetical protein
MMKSMIWDPQALENEFRGLLDKGMTIGDALRSLHKERGYGLLLLVPATAAVMRLDIQEAQRIVVREAGSRSDLILTEKQERNHDQY